MARLAGLRALSVQFPSEVRTNDWWRVHYPELVEDAEERTLARVFRNQGEATTAFDRAMRPYESDPFRGAVERRVAGDTDPVELEVAAARKALEAARLEPGDVDLLISTGFPRRDLVIGNAVHVAGALSLAGNAWNLESACGGPLNALLTAGALVDAGLHRRVLVTVSCTYLHTARPDDTLSWFMGDGAGAFVVSEGGARILGGHARHTADTCGTWHHVIDEQGIAMKAHPRTGPVMRASAEPQLLACSRGALQQSGLELDDIDFFVFHTPTAWFADFAAEALGVDRDRTVCTYRRYANVGPALTTANLFEAAHTGRLREGDRVLVFGPGSASSSVAVVLQWGPVGLGRPDRV